MEAETGGDGGLSVGTVNMLAPADGKAISKPNHVRLRQGSRDTVPSFKIVLVGDGGIYETACKYTLILLAPKSTH